MHSFVIIAVLNICIGSALCQTEASPAEDLANNLQMTFTVLTNLDPGPYSQYQGEIAFTYNGQDDIVEDKLWHIYFCSIRMFELPYLKNRSIGVELGNSGIKVYHDRGCLHRLEPTSDFPGFTASETVVLPFNASDWTVARTDIMPRWYIVNTTSQEAWTITSTTDEELGFVADFDTPERWKRREEDAYNPFTPEERFEHNVGDNTGPVAGAIIPTPVEQEVADNYIDISTGDWVIVYTHDNILNETRFLAEKLGMRVVDVDDRPTSRYIQLNLGEVPQTDNPEAYSLDVLAESSIINITGTSPAGSFYGAQSLLTLAEDPNGVAETRIIDYPRFPYRGMHLDVSRNFHGKEVLLRIFDAMAMYKMNKFHLHITDDEGWRLEMPDIPEATEVGSNRCFDLTGDRCIMSQLGSGPTTSTSGSGYFSVQDYREILQYASDRHIDLIPEFDMPGHGHGIIKAMEARYRKYNDSDMETATEYLLSDLEDESIYESAQMFNDNAVNPCINSTYTFIRHVMQHVKALHQDINPLHTYNYGGDEVPEGSWELSPKCKELVDITPGLNLTQPALLRYFAQRVAEIAHDEGLNLAAWEDGMSHITDPYNRDELPNDEVYVYTWENVWEWGSGDLAYKFANEDFKVILSHATALFFDHPQEPDPEERGYYWATRYTDTYQTFGYYPDDIYNNIDVTLFGQPIDKDEFCDGDTNCTPLLERKRENIIGMQGQLWTETSRSEPQLHSRMFPRILALAERSWHKGDWEDAVDEDGRDQDWARFANQLGHVELKRLDQMGIQYFVPPPGARIVESEDVYSVVYTLEANCHFPGLPIVYSIDDGQTWTTYSAPVQVPPQTEIQVQVRSTDFSRQSRTIVIETGDAPINAAIKTTGPNFLFVIIGSYFAKRLYP